jgi:hypothetical protein
VRSKDKTLELLQIQLKPPNSYLMDGQERMEKEMVKVKSRLLEPAESAELVQASTGGINKVIIDCYLSLHQLLSHNRQLQQIQSRYKSALTSEKGDVPGWVLVVLMTTGLVTAIWTIAAPRLTSILKNSLDAMNGIR